jgi:hypothetical protein
MTVVFRFWPLEKILKPPERSPFLHRVLDEEEATW